MSESGAALRSEDTTAGARENDPADIEKIAQARRRVHETYGKVALAMAALPRYRHLSLAELNRVLLEPLMRDRVAIATRVSDEPTLDNVSGIAIWASVSEELNQKIREQISAGVFPIRLSANDWQSGDIYWLFDVIASTQKMTTSVIMNLKQIIKEGDLRIHPLVARLVELDALKAMIAKPVETQSGIITLQQGTGNIKEQGESKITRRF